MFELISLISVVLAIAALASTKGTRARMETEIAALKLELKRLEAMRVAGEPVAEGDSVKPETEAEAVEPIVEPSHEAEAAEAPVAAEAEPQGVTEPVLVETAREPDADASAWTAPPAVKPRESFESRLAARWTVWVGGIALAFAGIFAVKYSIEQGLLSPAVRLSLAAVFGLVLMAVGEWVRRRTTPLVENTFQNALIPGILTAAGTLTLMGSVFVAHGVYGYIGPSAAFLLLAAISLATVALSLLHGQALAGLGLIASFVTPALVTSQNPSPWPLFGFLSVAWIGATFCAKLRDWRVAPAIANAGLAIWAMIYMLAADPFQVAPSTLPLLIMVAGLAFIWPGRWKPEPKVQDAEASGEDAPVNAAAIKSQSAWEQVLFPRHIASTFVAAMGITMAALVMVAPDHASTGYTGWGFATLVIAMALFGAFRSYAIYPAIFAALMAFGGVRIMSLGVASTGFNTNVEGAFVPAVDPAHAIWLALGLGLFFALLSSVVVHRRAEDDKPFANIWAVIGIATPLALGAFSFVFFGNYQFDIMHGLYAVLLAALYLGTAQSAFRGEAYQGHYAFGRDALIAGSWAALVFALLVMTNDVPTTLGVAFLGFAYLLALKVRNWPILPWGMVASAIFTAGRFAWEPTIVGADHLSKTPIFNALLLGYGTPSLLLIVSAWLMRKSEDFRIKNVLDALACLFSLLTLGILVRHAMNGGVLDGSVPTLAEQAIYTLLTVGASGTLMALDLRRPSIIFRFGSMAVGYISMISVISAHYVGLNPYFTGESTGRITFFNLLFLAYLLPGLAYAVVAWFARPRRPLHYVIALALTGASLLFAYVTLSVRRIYHGADISEWKGFLQAELYTYSVVWLLLGVALLVIGYRFKAKSIRIAAAVLVLITVVKVFLIDTAHLEGLYRVLSFIGLGVALIGIGRFYQTILAGLAGSDDKEEKPAETAVGEASG